MILIEYTFKFMYTTEDWLSWKKLAMYQTLSQAINSVNQNIVFQNFNNAVIKDQIYEFDDDQYKTMFKIRFFDDEQNKLVTLSPWNIGLKKALSD